MSAKKNKSWARHKSMCELRRRERRAIRRAAHLEELKRRENVMREYVKTDPWRDYCMVPGGDLPRGDAETRSGGLELRQFHRVMDRISAAYIVWLDIKPIVAALWRYYRGRGGLAVVQPVTREDAAE